MGCTGIVLFGLLYQRQSAVRSGLVVVNAEHTPAIPPFVNVKSNVHCGHAERYSAACDILICRVWVCGRMV